MTDLPAASANTMLNALIVPGTTYYLSLHSTDPGTTGAAEVTGGSYARQAIVFATASAGSQASTDAQAFTVPATSIGYCALWTAVTAGTYLGGGALASDYTLPAGSSVTFAIGAVTSSVS